MVAVPKQTITPRLTPQEYLERERKAETKSEYHDGLIVAMAGASPDHNTITSNVHGELFGQLRSGPCQAFVSDMRVRVPACNRYYYPDIAIACGEPQYQQLAGMQSLLNPTLIVEVLSESTEANDRGEKWMCYQTLDSLQAYVMVSQRQPYVEMFRRVENEWRYASVASLEGTLPLDVIGGALRLNDIYARITFPEPQGRAENGGAEMPA